MTGFWADFGPSGPIGGARDGQNGSRDVKSGPTYQKSPFLHLLLSGPARSRSDPFGPSKPSKTAQKWPKIDHFRPKSTHSDPPNANFGRFWPILLKKCQKWPGALFFARTCKNAPRCPPGALRTQNRPFWTTKDLCIKAVIKGFWTLGSWPRWPDLAGLA